MWPKSSTDKMLIYHFIYFFPIDQSIGRRVGHISVDQDVVCLTTALEQMHRTLTLVSISTDPTEEQTWCAGRGPPASGITCDHDDPYASLATHPHRAQHLLPGGV